MDKLTFCRSFVYLKRDLIRFDDRPYLPAVYAASHSNLVIKASRQVEKSTFLCNTILHEACTNPGVQILFVCPRENQSRVFTHSRLLPAIEDSPLIRRTLFGRSKQRPPITNMRFANGSQLFVRAAFLSADAARGISSDLLLIDEFQDVSNDSLPVLQETMSHSENPRTLLTGTPKTIDNGLDIAFRQSTANEWAIQCATCSQRVILNERCLGQSGVVCPNCSEPVDPRQGRWIARNPEASWGQGYWINHLMVPWVNFDEVLEKQRSYDLGKFKNEVLGLATTLGEHVVTMAELEACWHGPADGCLTRRRCPCRSRSSDCRDRLGRRRNFPDRTGHRLHANRLHV